ncbi:hypothetical protein BKI52_39750 [marine bacterium AO1-C]|nr:hypothetical protein BKI52_39750 [marine bacterium AO1-C]
MLRIYIISILLLSWGCHRKGNSIDISTIQIPHTQLNKSDQGLKRQGGKWFYKGKPYAGWIIEKYPDGTTKSKTCYYAGGEHGVSQGWYPGGSKWFERPYILGKKEGIHKVWWPSGQIKQVAHVTQDIYEGNVKSWYQDGKLYKDFNYKNGKEEGHQRAWKSDGRIKANYVVENGRRYGLTGVTNCKNVVEKKQN